MSGSSPVIFDYAIWSAVYPELAASVSEPQAQQYWYLASLYLDNTPCGAVPVLGSAGFPVRAPIMGMITSHIAALLAGINGQPPNPLVGRIASASEGSVSVATEFDGPVPAQWFLQTKYGAMAWQALAPFRTALYISGPMTPLNQQSYPFYAGRLGWLR